MVWTLISYSEIQVPLPPFEPGYVVGLAEDENKRRLIVQVEIEKTLDANISVGIKGKVKTVKLPKGSLNVFVPSF
ncbi:MAG: hypothetical protein ABSE80_07205 [Halobacteriota archaeon]|jgi:uncharacterized OB-fold protein